LNQSQTMELSFSGQPQDLLRTYFEKEGFLLSGCGVTACLERCSPSDGKSFDWPSLKNFLLETNLKDTFEKRLSLSLGKSFPKGPLVLQVSAVTDCSLPESKQYKSVPPIPHHISSRVLLLTLTDGYSSVKAVEYRPCPNLSIGQLTPGTKVVLDGHRVKFSHGFILLDEFENNQQPVLRVVGGLVLPRLNPVQLDRLSVSTVLSEEGGPPRFRGLSACRSSFEIKSNGQELHQDKVRNSRPVYETQEPSKILETLSTNVTNNQQQTAHNSSKKP